MGRMPYIKLSEEQIDKIGNSIIYFSQKIEDLSKTKVLKLLYILDELSIKKSGIPFFNLKYKLWKFGPVSEEIFIDLSSDKKLLKTYIKKSSNKIKPIAEFNDDEFSDNDIELLNFVIKEFGNKNARELVSYTHRKNSPWYITAKENAVLELLENEEISNTEFVINMESLVNYDERKRTIYKDYIEVN